MCVSRLFKLLVVAPSLLALVACTAAPVPVYAGGDEEEEETTTKKKKQPVEEEEDEADDTTGGTTTPPSTTPPATETFPDSTQPPPPADQPFPTTGCGAQKGFACVTCCIAGAAGQTAARAAEDAFGDCACLSPGVCKAQCGTSYCAGQQPTAACETCLNGATQCEDQATSSAGGGTGFDFNQLLCMASCI